jgi:DNA polymerase-1
MPEGFGLWACGAIVWRNSDKARQFGHAWHEENVRWSIQDQVSFPYLVWKLRPNFGVFPAEVKYFKALAGDSSDNVAGIKGVGKKTAIKIIEESRPSEVNPEFTGADRICLHPKVKDQAGTFLANLRLVTLENDVPELTWFASSPPFPVHVEAMLKGLEFKSLLRRKDKILKTLGCPVG